jgi:hypothetical protein
VPLRGLAAVLAGVVAVLGATATPASAHPFGDPQTVTITADPARPEVVKVRWKVGGLDDLTVLGVNLGLLPEDRVLLDGAVFYEPADAAAIGPSQEFAAYLRQQITVTAGGEPCAGTVRPPGDLAKAGADIDYTCPGAVGVASVAVRTLTDLNPAYRTLATGPGGAHAVYTSDAYTHDWSLTGEGANDAGRAVAQLAAVLGGLLVVAAVVFVLMRRRRKA